ncbi:M23 family metallopeptidase [Larkinella terrae]|uniref:Peptidoglycan DD-metalloendopeptidase family protein n=1 Tax=Larkinella terrae TaxID=2025311 RepID=A0A7K0EUQ6_9BACT|nr:M23 family metallopeptidase [Larkinella terrae]MRS65489.1 peptidoglycan DD-metalloendopeptidase family protein [Larkinella terrae]
MRWIGILSALWIALSNSASSQTAIWTGSGIPRIDSMCQQFQQLYTQIREESILPDSARKQFSNIMFGLRGKFSTVEPFRLDSVRRDSLLRTAYFSFPLRNYTPDAIGGSHGEGYRAKGFDLFDYNVRGSHPAQDIFITDRNQDCIDDNTDRPADVLSMTSGIVLAIETAWTPGQEYRGGNWIWVYDPILDGLWYYAHNNAILVRPGDWVQSGQKISEVGRTGFNAYPARSPTHLHIMYLQLQPDGLPLPQNPYEWLLTARNLN